MGLQNISPANKLRELKSFSEWMATVVNGSIGYENDVAADIEMSDGFLLKDNEDPIDTIMQSTYPDFKNIVDDLNYLKDKVILAPTLEVVDFINDCMIKMNDRETITYLSFDSACKYDTNIDILTDLHTLEFLSSLKYYGVSNHELNLKVGTPATVLKNIDHSRGLCNNTRLIIIRLDDRVLEGKAITGNNSSKQALIPKLFLTPSDPRLSLKF